MTIPDDFPTFLPVSKFDVPTSPTIAHLDIESTNRVNADQWKRKALSAQAEMDALKAEHEAEHRRDKTMYFTAGFLIGLAVPVGLLGSLLTRLFG